ncbi:transmembrane 9 family protein ASCRUDRAFT_10135 [Ascoidea rubescens DSM 1968]|uniref:Transmembrane 9 superfamily member n=1 Tax=Ascoidea rubescens DSM 1968 TaxID=1344418 RepID=A0A1D2VA37_9ASCO|nr:hypothetical protein ASCRUDRAFT_10135 [Ascoidea rubescens DSM 1968]ODV58546.1 hypothetical protein ASCRUDRAFT_10135 [Ascoidea rubescens DSM 1968]
MLPLSYVCCFLLVLITNSLLAHSFTFTSYYKQDYSKDDIVHISLTNLSPGANSKDNKYYLYPIRFYEHDLLTTCPPLKQKYSAQEFEELLQLQAKQNEGNKKRKRDDDDEKKDEKKDDNGDNNNDNNDDSNDNDDNEKKDLESSNSQNQTKEPSYDEIYIFKKDNLFNNNVYNSPFSAQFKIKKGCEFACTVDFSTKSAKYINDLIRKDYRINLYIDDIPIGKEFFDYNSNKFYISNNLPLGYLDTNGLPRIFTHYQIVIDYINIGAEKFNIIKAVAGQQSNLRYVKNSCSLHPPVILSEIPFSNNKVIFTYDIIWRETVGQPTSWKDRLNHYSYNLVNFKIQYLSKIVYSVLTSVFFLIFLKKIKTILTNEKHSSTSTSTSTSNSNLNSNVNSTSDLHQNALDIDNDELFLDLNWSSLSNEVFRSPSKLILFANLTGYGIQIFLIAFSVLTLLSFDLISVIIPNEILHSIFYLFILTSPFSSIVTISIFKNFVTDKSNLSNFKKLFFQNQTLLPGFLLISTLFLNIIYKNVNSTNFIPISNLFKFFLIWLFIYTPINLTSFVIGFKKFNLFNNTLNNNNNNNNDNGKSDKIIKINQIEKQIPPQPILLKLIPSSIFSSIIPFSIIMFQISILNATVYFKYFNFSNFETLYLLILSLISMDSMGDLATKGVGNNIYNNIYNNIHNNNDNRNNSNNN